MYLLYCIFHGREVLGQTALTGVDGEPVFPVVMSGLCAAVSEVNGEHLTPDVPRVMAYKQVVESLHNDRTVIPLRYGCVLRNRSQVIHLLKKNARRYDLLLKELDGCVEMGIRLMIDDCRSPIEGLKKREINAEIRHSKLKTSGKGYLAARKEHYAQEERITEAKDEIVRQFHAALTGLFLKCKAETPIMPDSQSSMLSLCFLVPGKFLDPFRQVFHNVGRSMGNIKLLLSGPWPPYNFVLPDNEYRRPALPDEGPKDN